MATLLQLADAIRSKNAGPFWLTVDVFFDNDAVYSQVRDSLKTPDVARRMGAAPEVVKRFDIDALRVIKFSLPRPAVQGTQGDRDMHGAAFACLLHDLDISP